MASAEHEPIIGVWRQSPQRVQGQSPWSGGRSPLKLQLSLRGRAVTWYGGSRQRVTAAAERHYVISMVTDDAPADAGDRR